MKVEFHPAAERELDVASATYEQLRDGLGLGLLDEVQDVCLLISEFPSIGRAVDSVHRSVPLRRFPFILFYEADELGVRVVAVAHKRKRPGYWKFRS